MRTPWTLASEAAWLFVAGGLLGFAGITIGIHPAICFGVFGVAAICPILYSLVLYKRLEKEGRL